MKNNIILKSATIGFIIGIIACFFDSWLVVSTSLFGDDLFMYGMVIPFLPTVLIVSTYTIYGVIIGLLIKNIKAIKSLFFKKNWRECFASAFLVISLFLYIWVFASCECLGCLFGFGLIGLSLFTAFIFIVISFIKSRFTTKNIILSIILFILLAILFSQIRMGSHLSHSWQEFNQSDQCLDDGGAWNYEGNYCEMYPETIIKNHIFNITIPVPGADDLAVTFNDIKSSHYADVAYGEFSDEKSIKKGSIAGHYWQTKKISKNLFVMPFSVNYDKGEELVYIGLFDWTVGFKDTAWQTKKITYLDKYLLGDKIEIADTTIIPQEENINKIVVDYLDYKNKQSPPDTTEDMSSLVIEIKDNKFINPQEFSPETAQEAHNKILGTNKHCEFLQISIPLWNSSGYEAIIPYKLCNDDEISFSLENGEGLILHDKNGDKKIMEFSKIAGETVETAIRYTAYGNNNLPKGCTIKKINTPNRWIISSSKENQINCGPYSQLYDDSIIRYFTVLNDFALAFMDESGNDLINFESVEVYAIE